MSYTISADGQSIQCHTCLRVSWNTNDVRERFCGHCHVFHHTEIRPVRLRRVPGGGWLSGSLRLASGNGDSLAVELDEGIPLESEAVDMSRGKLVLLLLRAPASEFWTDLLMGEDWEIQELKPVDASAPPPSGEDV